MDSDYKTPIRISLIHYPVYCLGIGRRIGIWLQGCSIGCPGCISTHTWNTDGGIALRVGDVIEETLKANVRAGITISGGEPFDQPDALFELIKGLRKEGFKDIMIYSGYDYNRLYRERPQILDMIDVLIDGRFIKGDETGFVWKGSDNQNMIILSKDKALREEYEDYMSRWGLRRTLQAIESRGRIYVIGIPDQKDSERIRDGLI